MRDTTHDTSNHAGGQRSYEVVLADAVRVLTEAARRTTTWTDPDGCPHRERADFAEFVTHALAGAAANLGGIEQALAGRPGSWEADKLRDLLHATVGYDEHHLLGYRSEPIVVRVHVENILVDLGFWHLYDDARTELERRYEAIGIPSVDVLLGDPQFEAVLAQLPPGTPEQQAAADTITELEDRLEEQQQREWAAYGQAFAANVHQAAAELFPGLRVPVEVIVKRHWQSELGPDFEFNGPEWRLWETARLNTPLPGTGIPLRDYPSTTGTTVSEIETAAGRDPLTRLQNAQGQR